MILTYIGTQKDTLNEYRSNKNLLAIFSNILFQSILIYMVVVAVLGE